MFGFKIVKASVYQELVDELSRAKQLVITHEAKEADLRIALDLVKKELDEAKAADAKEEKAPRSDKKVVREGETKRAPRKRVVRKEKEEE